MEDLVLCAGQLDTTGEGTPYPILGVERRSGVNLYYITVIHVGIGWPRTQATFCLTAAIETKCVCGGGGGGGGGGGEGRMSGYKAVNCQLALTLETSSFWSVLSTTYGWLTIWLIVWL